MKSGSQITSQISISKFRILPINSIVNSERTWPASPRWRHSRAHSLLCCTQLALRFPRPDIIREELAADAAQKALFEKRLARRLKAG